MSTSTSEPDALRIGELADRTGVSPRSLRYYGQQGLLTSERTTGGHRVYGREAVRRVEWIQRFYAAGLCSSKIGELLPFVDGCRPAGDSAGRPGLSLRTQLEAELARVDGAISDMQSSRAELARLLAASDDLDAAADSRHR